MLDVNKPLMEQTFRDMITVETGLLYKAAYEAHYATSEKTYEHQMNSYNSSNTNPETVVGRASGETKQMWDLMAKEFAKAFVETLNNEGFHTILANEIDKHVKSIEPMITMVVPTHGALSGAMGPVSGTLIGSVSNGAIQIM